MWLLTLAFGCRVRFPTGEFCRREGWPYPAVERELVSIRHELFDDRRQRLSVQLHAARIKRGEPVARRHPDVPVWCFRHRRIMKARTLRRQQPVAHAQRETVDST